MQNVSPSCCVFGSAAIFATSASIGERGTNAERHSAALDQRADHGRTGRCCDNCSLVGALRPCGGEANCTACYRSRYFRTRSPTNSNETEQCWPRSRSMDMKITRTIAKQADDERCSEKKCFGGMFPDDGQIGKQSDRRSFLPHSEAGKLAGRRWNRPGLLCDRQAF